MTELRPIVTPRLTLRGFRESDHPALALFFASPRSSFVGGLLSEEDSWRRMSMFIGHWALRGYGPLVIEEKTSGREVGYSGLWKPHGWAEPEILWSLYEGHEGQGYAAEAGRACREHAYRILGWPTVVSYIKPANEASRRVARRLGAVHETTITQQGGATEVWRHPAPAQLSSANHPSQGEH